ASYERVWTTTLSIRVGGAGISQSLRDWIDTGLMTFFFFVIGLEARRELDLGELRDRRRVTLPVVAGLGGMLVPVLIYLAFNAGRASQHGWGTAMSTDTAFALGLLSLVGSACPAPRGGREPAADRFRLFREQRTGDLARSARAALRTAVSPNERLQTLWHPWTSYVIVPLFALANAGVHLSGGFLGRAYSSPL